MARAVAVSAAIVLTSVPSIVADGQFGPAWTRIAHCDGVQDSVRLDLGLGPNPRYNEAQATLRAVSARATQVKICSWGSTTDCVTSRPGSFPIENFKSGYFFLSHDAHSMPGLAPSSRAIVQATWAGPAARLENLVAHCAESRWGTNPDNFRHTLYQACGNANGLHFSMDGPGRCSWTYRQNDRLEIFINTGTVSPSSSPSAAPTAWYDLPSHETNISEMQSRMISTDSAIRELRMELASQREAQSTLMSMVTDLTVMVDNAMGATREISRIIESNVTEDLSTIKGALVDAVSNIAVPNNDCSEDQCKPAIVADGNNIAIRAPSGQVTVTGGSCENVDVCGVSNFVLQLRDALANLG